MGSSLPGIPGEMAKRREIVGRHLLRVCGPGVGSRQLARMTDEVFASYARYWAESLRIPSLPRHVLDAGMTYRGFDHIEASEAAGRGTILALPHLGGWEWAGAHMGLTGHPVGVVVERLEPADVFEWFVRYREKLGMRVIPAGPGAAAECAQVLGANRILCLLSDRLITGTSGVEVEFFGERTLLPAGPATLALRTGAAMLPVAVYFKVRSDRHVAIVRPPVPPERRGRLRADVQVMTQALARELEWLIRRAPTQWHIMQPNWPSDPK